MLGCLVTFWRAIAKLPCKFSQHYLGKDKKWPPLSYRVVGIPQMGYCLDQPCQELLGAVLWVEGGGRREWLGVGTFQV